MNLDVMINSCARPDILEISISTFKKHIKTNHNLRYVILEDKVDDERRQEAGRKWIESNKYLFDEIHCAEKRMGPGFFFAPIVKLCQTPFFFHLEDDNEFLVDINIDPILEMMKRHDDIANVVLRRGMMVDKRNHPKAVIIDGIELTKFDLYSVATGLFNVNIAKTIIDKAGWHNQLREVQVLGKLSQEMKFKKYTLGRDNSFLHYNHIGPNKGYRKGSWKKN